MEIIELIDGCRKWHKKAQNELYDKYAPRLFAVSLRYVADRDLARDVLQEALIKIYKNIGSFTLTDDKAFYCWMHRITVNTALNHLRKDLKNKLNTEIQNFENEISNDTYEESFSVYDEIIACIGSRALFTMVGELPDGYRTVFNLYVVEGFSHKEIAEQLDITINTSKTQLFKARKMLMSKINGIVKNNTLKEVV
ncbi:MAG TPA: sigma-70 family RNA polymerase sigma factor [Bacteroidales bacterium]|jgi:RNA polymerase sigma-70 factor (ECF subfamily)|nr:sigma-70 family RNA polymerase sigma factor [Bacteroidales bacterium]HNZ41866.1 sigma-70 family RNA polymerase sigma factor [Bacteroidales bacterium]HOH84181.1 sigma-70 family RNA polymerase sigma factor [Bacteroidales bacterium]HPB24451.1 sigma-70 family RNA polymerase sigma factor [Bacteroidales bacterium]HPI29282.1 sigma-70 family RNA polymerase sigma factor [Bacteroidales bacterium]